MRCLECQRLLSTSYIDDVHGHVVYQCSSAGVPLFRLNKNGVEKQVGSTTNHSDLFFVRELRGRLVRVVPVDLGKDTRPSLEGHGKETFHTWTYRPFKKIELKKAS